MCGNAQSTDSRQGDSDSTETARFQGEVTTSQVGQCSSCTHEKVTCSLLSTLKRCCLGGSSTRQPIFCCSSHSPVTCPHPVLHISRSSAVRPTLQSLAPIQSFTSFSQDLFGLPLFLWPFTFPSSNNLTTVWCPCIRPK